MESPAGLNYARYLAAKRVEAETNTTELELAIIAAATTANLATAIVSHCELRSAIEFCELTSTRHLLGSLLKNELYGYGVKIVRAYGVEAGALKGIPRCLRSARPSSSVRAVVTNEMFMPLITSMRS
jgi:seryl-tRNA(Sec) selenium transferase